MTRNVLRHYIQVFLLLILMLMLIQCLFLINFNVNFTHYYDMTVCTGGVAYGQNKKVVVQT